MRHQLSEGLNAKDLLYLVGNKIHFDEYDSKMGDADDVVTVSFKVKQRMPAEDLTNFIENGYDWVLDADVSTGEIDDDEYLVFVEMPRRGHIFERMIELLDDLQHLTDIKLKDWQFKWYKGDEYYPLEEVTITEIVPDSPRKYRDAVEQFQPIDDEKKGLTVDLSQINKLSGIS